MATRIALRSPPELAKAEGRKQKVSKKDTCVRVGCEKADKDSPQSKMKLKKSCENCSKMKLKCTGEYPVCRRCELRGKTCVYLPRKKRVNAPKACKDIVAKKQTRVLTCIDSKKCIHGREKCNAKCIEYIVKQSQPYLFPELPKSSGL